MIDEDRASRLAQQALELCLKGNVKSAVPLFREAIIYVPPWKLGDYQGQLGRALAQSGEIEAGCEQLKLSLATERAQHTPGYVSAVSVARYFLAQHYLVQNEPQLALETIDAAEVEEAGEKVPPFLFSCRAFALHALGRVDEASVAACVALDAVPTEERRNSMAAMFKENGIAH